MFEGFSFPPSDRSLRVPGGSGDDPDGAFHCESALVSPLSSRCPSPRLRPRDYSTRLARRARSPFRRGPAPTSIPPALADHHRLSIGSLTTRLHAHSLDASDSGADSDDSHGSPRAPRSAYLDPGSPPTWMDRRPSFALISPADSDSYPAGYGSPYADVSPTSTPRSDRRFSQPANCTSVPSTFASRQGSVDAAHRRQSLAALRLQREQLSIIQCAATSVADTVRLAQMLDQDERFRYGVDLANDGQHPSSLPPARTQSRILQKKMDALKAGSSSSSSSSSAGLKLPGSVAGKSKIDKTYPAAVEKKHARASPSSLRRRSLVLAAVTAVLEAETSTQYRDSIAAPDQLRALGAYPQPTPT
ncbi:hypothetical protein LOZ58_000167 [Ophidiomyces ophidiicola]|nr:hypothetical protein LOZ58_000167 [Ophidiomyces ophidiicola]